MTLELIKKQGIDVDRCRRGMEQLRIVGRPRPQLIDEACAYIQSDPEGAFMKRYYGIKNYGADGDAREDHEYGEWPQKGTIVFQIGRTEAYRRVGKRLDLDAIYFLLAYRDWGAPKFNVRFLRSWANNRTGYETFRPDMKPMTLALAIITADQLQELANAIMYQQSMPWAAGLDV